MNRFKYLVLFILIFAGFFSCQKIVEMTIKKNLESIDMEILKDDKLHVILIGSGGPINSRERTATSTAIIAGGEFILVDVGPCSIRSAGLLGLPLGNISGIFLTHFHSDHIADLGEANFATWVAGRKKSLEVFGPEGVDRVVKGFTMAYKLDTEYRIAHHGEDVLPSEAGKLSSETIKIAESGKAELFFDRNGLKAYAFTVDHFPVKPAYGYRFEYRGNTVVITGDTKKTETLASHSKNADILIADGLSFKLVSTISRVASENNRPRIARITKDIQTYHMDPIHAAEVANEANAKKLVFFHIVPPLGNMVAEKTFLEGVSDVYNGDVVLGEDGMRFDLDPKD